MPNSYPLRRIRAERLNLERRAPPDLSRTKHLKHPESQELEEVIAFVIEARVRPGLDDPEEQEARKSQCPDHDQYGRYYIASIITSVDSSTEQSEECQDEEIGSSGEISDLVKFECPGDRKNSKLISDRDQECYGEVIRIENIDMTGADHLDPPSGPL